MGALSRMELLRPSRLTKGERMKKEHIRVILFLALASLAIYLFYRLLVPFMVPLCWGAIFAIVCYPLYRKLERWISSPSLRAFIMSVLVVIMIIGPIAYLSMALVQEAITMFDRFTTWVDAGHLGSLDDLKNTPVYHVIQERLSPYVDLSQLDLKVIIQNALKSVSGLALGKASNVLTNAGRLIFHFCLTVFFTFFFFRDGAALFAQIKAVIPLSREKAELTIVHLRRVIESSLYGGLLISLIQGFLGGLLFVIMGLPSPVFWGAFMAFLAILPVVGPFLVYVPASLILIFSGSPVKGILLIVIAFIVHTLVDNFVRPYLASRESGMHPMLLFLSIMGGATMFGLLGIVLGPLIAAVFVTVFDILRLRLLDDGDGGNGQGEPSPTPPPAGEAQGVV